MTIFGCTLDDDDLVRACGPEQPAKVKVGQKWMNVQTGDTYPVKRAYRGLVDLGSVSYTIIVTEDVLRSGYVCTDPPDNVTELAR